MKGKYIKKLATLFAFTFMLTLPLSACVTEEPPPEQKTCKVILSEGDNFDATENIKTVNKGQNVKFSFTIENGYTFDSVNYGDYEVAISQPNANGERNAELTLKNVKYPTNIEVQLKQTAKLYNLSLVQSQAFRCETPTQQIEEGETAIFTLYFKQEFTIKGVNYNGAFSFTGAGGEVNENNERQVTLILNNVTQSANILVEHTDFVEEVIPPDEEIDIQLSPISGYAVVGYHLNGGEFTNGWTDDYFTVSHTLLNHRRPNTEIGTDKISRYGYTLKGWNTKSNGSGTHVGLGSRVSVYRDQAQMLYAEWEKWSDEDLFEYSLIDEEDAEALYKGEAQLEELVTNANSQSKTAVITGYSGEEECLVIPEEIDGVPVGIISTNAIKANAQLKTLILPKSIKYLLAFAVDGCESFTELYIYDNIVGLSENAFGNESLRQTTVQTLHVNAITPPQFVATENGQFTNKVEMLIDRTDIRQKIVLFGSCSLWYGFDTTKIRTEMINRYYNVLNMGVVGGTCALYQVEIIMRYLSEGDIFIDFFELASMYQLYGSFECDNRVFETVEANYDLLALVNIKHYDAVFKAFNEHVERKNNLLSNGVSASYDDYNRNLGKQGDMLKKREGGFDNEGSVYDLTPCEDILQNNCFENMAELFAQIKNMGVRVYATFGPINDQGLDMDAVDALSNLFKEKFSQSNFPATLISDIYDSIFDKYYFFDTNYHLSEDGSAEYTKIIGTKIYEALLRG